MTSYRYSVVLRLGLGGVTFLCLFFLLYLLVSSISDADLLEMLPVPLLAWGVIIYLRTFLSRSSILLDDQLIAACMFGFRTKVIKWQDVAKIKKIRGTNGYTYVDSYQLFDRRSHNLICRFLLVNLCGSILFTQEIHNLEGLVQEINLHARRHAIPLVMWDAEATANLRAKEWSVLRVEEVPVDEF
jgi:hypothetical protein